ncbi:uncharacterized protein LOC143368000 [Andrena cerasifolii]|uniref:uncharacterized protein LOC143368000 n=1 Tax=Andrena cerasifolii TaxID=2819439 RepID=UPI0040382ABF
MLQDCNNSNAENMTKANVAATRIQANFRGYRVRKRLKELNQDLGLESSGTAVLDREREQRRLRKERLEGGGGRSTIPSEENAAKESLEEQSATKIQARVRGFLVRKRQQIAQVAATRIQAGFRGFRTRKLLKQCEQ